jgi:ribosomal protein S18 acetylase RimI-like enzyme
MQSAPSTIAALRLRPLHAEEIAPLAAGIEETSEPQLRNRWHEQQLGYRELLLAELDGRPVGTVSIAEAESPRRSLHLFALEVVNQERNRGIGATIIRQVIEEARRRGRERVFLEVRVDNPARRLYQRLGFRRVGPSFLNAWWEFLPDGSRKRVEEPSYRMVKRVSAPTRPNHAP